MQSIQDNLIVGQTTERFAYTMMNSEAETWAKSSNARSRR
jgi:hypothetical protein